MSEIIPPSKPEPDTPPSFPLVTSSNQLPLGKGACAAIGAALFVGSTVLAFVFPPLAVLTLVGVFVTLFIEGYRYIFVGYILTLLILTGLIFLAIIVICGNGHNHM